MTSGFEERKKKHEDKWALDEELRFKATARRNKLLGLWAAGEMGLTAGEAETYAKAVVAAAMHPGGAAGKVAADLAAKGFSHGEEAIQHKLAELELVAREQIQRGV